MSVPVYPMYEHQPRARRATQLRRTLLTLVCTLLTWVTLTALALACCAESVLTALVLASFAAVAYGLRVVLERLA